MNASNEAAVASGRPAGPDDGIDPERVALVWMDAEQAYITRWRDEPVIERLDSDVPPRRPAVGSVRRGPARPAGGGSVPGHGTEGRHEEHLERFMEALASALVDLQVIEVAGRGMPHRRLATHLGDRARRTGSGTVVITRTLSRRPSERQMMARMRKMVDQELPRRRMGRYRVTTDGPTTATGRPTPASAGRRTLRPAPVPERREIDSEVELMLADEGTTPDARD